MSKLAVWSSSCFSTLVQVSWPGPCCLVLVFCCFIQSLKFSYQQRGSSTGIQIIHLVIVLFTKRYCFQAVDTQLAPGARNEDGQHGAKSSQDTFLSRSCGKSCGLRTKHKEGRKTAKQLVFSEIEISNLNLGYLSPSELYRQLCIGQPLPSPCFSNNCYLFLFVDLICDHGLVTNDVRLISRGCSVIGTIMQTWIPNHAHNGGHSIWGLQWLLVSGCEYACILSCKYPCTLLHFSISFHCLVMNWILSLTHSTSTRV